MSPGEVPQAGVGAVVVVVIDPIEDGDLRFLEREEQLLAQELEKRYRSMKAAAWFPKTEPGEGGKITVSGEPG